MSASSYSEYIRINTAAQPVELHVFLWNNQAPGALQKASRCGLWWLWCAHYLRVRLREPFAAFAAFSIQFWIIG